MGTARAVHCNLLIDARCLNYSQMVDGSSLVSANERVKEWVWEREEGTGEGEEGLGRVGRGTVELGRELKRVGKGCSKAGCSAVLVAYRRRLCEDNQGR